MDYNQNISSASPTGPIRPALIVGPENVGRYVNFLRHLFVGLADEGHNAALICPPQSDTSFVLSLPVEVIRHPFLGLKIFWRQNRTRLIEQLDRYQPTVLHCLSESRASLTQELSRHYDIPYILMFDSLGHRRFSFPISATNCARILVPCSEVAVNIKKILPSFADCVEQLNIGTFVSDMCACFSDMSRLASIVIVHPLDRAADFEPLLDAVRHLAIDGYGFVLAIIGTGRADLKLRRIIKKLGLSQTVNIVPSIQPLRSVFESTDIFIKVQPAKSFDPNELEAMSVGAVVAGCKGGVNDLLIDGQTGVTFEPKDHLSIYSTLRSILDNKEQARSIALNSQEYLRQNHSVTAMVTSLVRIYRNARIREAALT